MVSVRGSSASIRVLCGVAVLGLIGAGPVLAGAHTWDVNELFTNADGTIQFVELREANGTPNELGVNGQSLRSTAFPTHTITLLNPISAPTSNKFLLGGTVAFAALPGAPALDFMIPNGFLSRTGPDSISYGPYDTLSYGAGAIPLDGVNAFRDGGTTGPNTPTNYAGVAGSVDASPQPPAVPNGAAGAPMIVTPLSADGSTLSISWDTTTCSGNDDHAILYGDGSMFPSAPGGAFGMLGSVCGMGATSPFTWSSVPTAADGTGILWWVMVVTSGAKEGSWGRDSAGIERIGPGSGGSSGQCGVTQRVVTNTCGH